MDPNLIQNNPENVWNKIYQRSEQISLWPWSDLVSIVSRYAQPKTQNFRVLELGCGAGANIPFFLSLSGCEYFSVETSEVAVSKLHKKFPELKNNIILGDFTEALPNRIFDLIVDRGALTCNSTDAINMCLQYCYDQLRPNGKYVGIDWLSTKCSSFLQGEVEDDWTRLNFKNGPYIDQFRLHFSSKEHLYHIFSKFSFQHLVHKTIESEFDIDHPVLASWNFVVAKEI